MTKPISRKASNLFLVFESILNLAVLLLSVMSISFSVYLISEVIEGIDEATLKQLEMLYNTPLSTLILMLLFVVLALIRVIRGFRFRYEKGQDFFRLSMVQAGGFVVCSLLVLILGISARTMFIVCILAGLLLIAGRVLAIVKKRRPVNIILNAVAIFATGYAAFNFTLMFALFFLVSVFSLLSIVFARVRFSVLKSIVVKTHAVEIIFGLLLLIVTFSLLLTFFEPGMSNFKDALWFCFAIVTTIGLGDVTAVTDFGRILAVILGAYGIVVVALITSIIVNFYGEMKKPAQAVSDGGEEAADATEAAAAEKS